LPDDVRTPGVTSPTQRRSSGRFLTDVLVDLGFVPRERVQQAIDNARETGQTPEQVLLAANALSQDQLSRAVAERFGLDHLDLNEFQIDMGAANLVSASAVRRYGAVPVGFVDERTLLVAMLDPANVLAVDDIAIMTGLEVRVAVASEEDVTALVTRLNRLDDVVQAAAADQLIEELDPTADIVDLRESADDAPVIKLVHSVIGQAIEQGASDIHFEPEGTELRVRFRVDGVLAASATVPKRMVRGVVSRIKIMSNLDISEKRIPQDGRVGLNIEGHHVDVRVVTLPSVHGESVVMRILDKEGVVMEMERLGMLEPERERYQAAISQAYGAVLVTGPTGSGKSTTSMPGLVASAGSGAAGSTASGTTGSGSTGSGSAGSGSSGSGSAGSGSTGSPTIPAVPSVKPTVVAALQFGLLGGSPTYRRVAELTPLPSPTSPAVVYLGQTRRGESAFLVSAEVTPRGQGRCTPSRGVCSTLYLKPGQVEYLTAQTTAGRPISYRLKFVERVKPVKVTEPAPQAG